MGQTFWCLAVFLRIVVGQVEIGVLKDFSSTLTYLDGNCSWTLTAKILGTVQEFQRGLGPQTEFHGEGIGSGGDDVILKCIGVEDENLKLQAVIKIYGVDEIPSPMGISLIGTNLKWSYIVQPSNLPPGFVLTMTMNISYLVTVRDVESGESGETMMSHETSLNISHILDHCRRQDFTVQTLVNDIFYSQSSSYLTNPSAPAFLTISPSLMAEDDNTVSVKVKFALEASVCVSQFHVIIDGLVNISFNVTNSDREREDVTYDLSPYISPEDVCNVEAVVYGSNDIGDGTPVQIPRGGSPHCMPTDIAMPTLLSTTPTLTPPYSEDSVPGISVTVIITATTVLVVIMIAVLLLPVLVLYITRKCKYRGKGLGVTEDVSLQTNEAYCTVTTGVPMKRNEAYETVLRPETDTLSPVYDIVH